MRWQKQRTQSRRIWPPWHERRRRLEGSPDHNRKESLRDSKPQQVQSGTTNSKPPVVHRGRINSHLQQERIGGRGICQLGRERMGTRRGRDASSAMGHILPGITPRNNGPKQTGPQNRLGPPNGMARKLRTSKPRGRTKSAAPS